LTNLIKKYEKDDDRGITRSSVSPILQMTGKNTGGAACVAGDVGEEHGERETTTTRGEGAGAAGGGAASGGTPSPEGATVGGGTTTGGAPSPEGALPPEVLHRLRGPPPEGATV